MADIGDRILDAVTKQGERLARIEERVENSNTGLHEIKIEVKDMKEGGWLCPTGQAIKADIVTMKETNKDQWAKINDHKHSNNGNGTIARKPLTIKAIAMWVAGIVVGVGMAVVTLAFLFGN